MAVPNLKSQVDDDGVLFYGKRKGEREAERKRERERERGWFTPVLFGGAQRPSLGHLRSLSFSHSCEVSSVTKRENERDQARGTKRGLENPKPGVGGVVSRVLPRFCCCLSLKLRSERIYMPVPPVLAWHEWDRGLADGGGGFGDESASTLEVSFI